MQSDNFLSEARRQFPDLDPQDAFIAPRWYLAQDHWISGTDKTSAAAYNYPLGLRVRGPLNLAAVQNSVNALIERHEILRSAFRICDGEVLQIIRGASQAVLSIHNLTDLPATRRETQARRLATDSAKELFDFSLGPLLRAVAITLAEDDHVIVLTSHHLVCDDWSAGILVRDFLALYKDFLAGIAARELPELQFQYGDFVRWRQTEAKQPAISQSDYLLVRKRGEEDTVLLSQPSGKRARFTGQHRGNRTCVVFIPSWGRAILAYACGCASSARLRHCDFLWVADKARKRMLRGIAVSTIISFDIKTGSRAWKSELSTIDTAFLLAGILIAALYFDGDCGAER